MHLIWKCQVKALPSLGSSICHMSRVTMFENPMLAHSITYSQIHKYMLHMYDALAT